MKQRIQKLGMISAIVVLAASCSKNNNDGYNNGNGAPVVNKVVFSAAGDNATVTAKLNDFRASAGDPVNSAPGATTGRREVNWDGVPVAFTNSNNFPFD